MNITAQRSFYPASHMNSSEKKLLALNALKACNSISQLARDKKVSRQFIYKQKTKALDAIDSTYQTNAGSSRFCVERGNKLDYHLS